MGYQYVKHFTGSKLEQLALALRSKGQYYDASLLDAFAALQQTTNSIDLLIKFSTILLALKTTFESSDFVQALVVVVQVLKYLVVSRPSLGGLKKRPSPGHFHCHFPTVLPRISSQLKLQNSKQTSATFSLFQRHLPSRPQSRPRQ